MQLQTQNRGFCDSSQGNYGQTLSTSAIISSSSATSASACASATGTSNFAFWGEAAASALQKGS